VNALWLVQNFERQLWMVLDESATAHMMMMMMIYVPMLTY